MKDQIIEKLNEAKNTVDSNMRTVIIQEAIVALSKPEVFIPDRFQLGLLVTGLACYYTDRNKKLQKAKKASRPGHSPAAYAMELASVHELFEQLHKITEGIKAAAAAEKQAVAR
jgi:hypothetical protein